MPKVSTRARIGVGVDIAETAVVFDNVQIDDHCSIGEYCVVGEPARAPYTGQPLLIGAGGIIRSHTVLYEGSRFGAGVSIGHHALLRAGIVAGRNLQVGSYCDLEGETKIGNWVRMHS